MEHNSSKEDFTANWIDSLAKDLKPVTPVNRVRYLLLSWVFLGSVSTVLFLAMASKPYECLAPSLWLLSSLFSLGAFLWGRATLGTARFQFLNFISLLLALAAFTLASGAGPLDAAVPAENGAFASSSWSPAWLASLAFAASALLGLGFSKMATQVSLSDRLRLHLHGAWIFVSATAAWAALFPPQEIALLWPLSWIAAELAHHYSYSRMRLVQSRSMSPMLERSFALTQRREGELLPSFDARAVDGSLFNANSFKGKTTWLILYRYAGCPLCKHHMQQLKKHASELAARGIEVVAVFETSAKRLAQIQGETPFRLVSDSDRSMYRAFGARRSWVALFQPGPFVVLIKAHLLGLFQGVIDGPLNQVPAHFVVGGDGRIKKAHYNTHVVDHLSLESVLALSA